MQLLGWASNSGSDYIQRIYFYIHRLSRHFENSIGGIIFLYVTNISDYFYMVLEVVHPQLFGCTPLMLLVVNKYLRKSFRILAFFRQHLRRDTYIKRVSCLTKGTT